MAAFLFCVGLVTRFAVRGKAKRSGLDETGLGAFVRVMRRTLMAVTIAVATWPAFAQSDSSGSEPPSLHGPNFPSAAHGPAFPATPSDQQSGPSSDAPPPPKARRIPQQALPAQRAYGAGSRAQPASPVR